MSVTHSATAKITRPGARMVIGDLTAYGWAAAERAYFAAGTNFPDALAGVAAAAFHDAPLLLTRDDCLPGPVFDVTTSLAPQTKVLLGGSTVLNEDALEVRCA